MAAVDGVVRAEALRLLVEEGCSARESARRVGVSESSVRLWASLRAMTLQSRTRAGGLTQVSIDQHTAGGQLAGGQLAGGQLAGGQAAGGQPAGGQPAGGQPAGGQPAGGQPAGGQLAVGRPAGGGVGLVGGRLTAVLRGQIRCRLLDGWSARRIARELGVAPTTITREMARGHHRGRYDPGFAEREATRRRARPRAGKLGAGPLREMVVAGLGRRQSPQQIARRLRRDYPDREDLWVSHETIYQALYVQGRGSLREELRIHLQIEKVLRSGRAVRRARSKLPARPGKPWLTGAHISQRPAEACDRAVPGHWEGDLVIGGITGGRGGSALITLVERASRYCLIARLPDLRTSPVVVAQLTAMITQLPATLRRSLTWDQGSEMAHHAQFSVATDCQVFFCDPHSPWQRGSNENLNGLIRDYYPKGTDFAQVSDADIQRMQDQLNTRPRMTLDWMNPAEKLDQLLTVALTS